MLDRFPLAINVTISNVPAPPLPIYLASTKVTTIHPLGPLMEWGIDAPLGWAVETVPRARRSARAPQSTNTTKGR